MSPHAAWAALREWALRISGTVRRRRADADIEQELRSHLEMAEEALRARGHSPAEAARLARVEHGAATSALDSVRAQRSLPALDTFALDARLGLRMLRKHFGLTLIGGLTMVGAMTFGAAIFDGWHVATQTELPLDEGDRVVVLQPWDPLARTGLPTSVRDFERWRETLSSVEDIAAYRFAQRNLVTSDGAAVPVGVAQMTAAGFRVARVPALLGRTLIERDDAPAAPPVVVLGYDAWQSRFGADPDVVGQSVQLDGAAHTVVGVMPEGFRFPVSHQYWTNAPTSSLDRVVVFGRLVPGATLQSADAEIRVAGFDDAVALGTAAEPPRPRVVPYIAGIMGEQSLGILLLIPLLAPLVLLPPCVNIAILIYARTVARQGEFAARAALGATRARIVAQVFVEMLVLAACAAAVAGVLAPKLVDYVRARAVIGGAPFWIDFGFSYATIGYTAVLAVIAALIAGAIPALRATGRGRLASLHTLGARSAPRLGKLWTGLVVAQVALSAATVPFVAEIAWVISGPAVAGTRFVPEDYLVARLRLDDTPADEARFAAMRGELARLLEAEPGVTAVTFSQSVPSNESSARIEVEDAARTADGSSHVAAATFNRVDAQFFDAFAVRLLTGRGFGAGDAQPEASSIVANQTFARRLLGDGSPLGRRVRVIRNAVGTEAPAAGPWLEIVGVVEDFSAQGGRPTFYQPLARAADEPPANDDGAGAQTLSLAIHASASLLPALSSRLRQLAAASDANLRVDPIITMDRVYAPFAFADEGVASALAGVMLGVLLLAAAGVYTLLAFAVVQRRREIGIRSALGAQPWALIAGIFRRVLVPVAVAAGAGALGAVLLDRYVSPVLFDFTEGGRPLPWILAAGEAFIVLIGLLVIAGPARRALRVDPVEALRDE